jgi:hypothetical protein
MRRKIVWAACAALAALMVGGCGGGGGSSRNHLSRSEFLAKGNVICSKSGAEIGAAAHKALGSGRPTPAQFTRFATGSVIPASETLLVELGKLAPPAGDEKRVTAILHAQQAAIDRLKANPAALAREDPFATTQRLAAAYGLKACGPSS